MDDITTSLAAIGRAGAFAVRSSMPCDNLRLEVRGVGPIALPVTKSRARKLCTVARPARYGLRDRTLLDRKVRDTWEIARSRIRIDQRRWNKALLPELDRIRRTLGLADGCELRADLHNLLVYGPGQFFASHQDTEKTDGMIGSLVVTLPSDFSGGAMVVEHHDERVVSRGSATKLSLVAFYADCHHAVRPIREGFRVALTYNLVLVGDSRVEVPERQVNALTQKVRRFFETPVLPAESNAASRPPDRLVYLLDHQYTEQSLDWARLKNADAARAAALQEIARRLDCEIFLALADVHELWSCVDDSDGYAPYDDSYDSYDDHYDDACGEEDEVDESGDLDHPELTDLEDYDIELRHWVGAAKAVPAPASRVAEEELCFTKPSVELEPFRSEHEPYMGNWGNTVERWYHRAAVVMWPRDRAFVIRAKASASWAVGAIETTLEDGDIEGARRLAEQAVPFWGRTARAEQSAQLLRKTLALTVKLGDADLAAALLQPFEIEQLSPKAAPRLVALLELHGLDWCRSLLAGWASTPVARGRQAWLLRLPDLVRAFCARGGADGTALARWLVGEQWHWLAADAHERIQDTPPSELLNELADLHRPLLALLESARLAGSTDLHGDMLRSLTTPELRGPILNLARLLREAYANRSRQPLQSLALGRLAEHCVDTLTALLARPPRADDDWSIRLAADCACELCRTLDAFLAAPRQTRLEWPLAKDQRAHVHGVIDERELPVTHTRRRSGRPYTLVLEKTPALFRQEANERKAWLKALAWLEGRREAFG